MITATHNTPKTTAGDPVQPETRVLLVSGSPRRGGNTDLLLSLCADELADRGIPTETVRLCDIELHPCTGCEACRKSATCTRFTDGMTELYPIIERSRGLVIASPTYNYTVTPEIKAFIDRLYPYFDFTEPRPGPYRARLANQGRGMIPIGVCEQNEASEMRYTIPVMRDPLEVIGYTTVSEVAITGHFYKGTVAKDIRASQQVISAIDSLSKYLQTHEDTGSSSEV